MEVALGRHGGTGELMALRCERGATIASGLDFPDETAGAIRALDEHWDGHGQPDGLAGEAIPLLGRILQLAQTTEVFFGADGVLLTDEDQLDRVAEAFADVIDAKSPWTYRHSTAVARYSVGIAAELGLDAAAQRRLRRDPCCTTSATLSRAARHLGSRRRASTRARGSRRR